MSKEKQKTDSRHISRILAAQYLFTVEKSSKDKLQLNVYEPNFLLSILDENKFNLELYANIVEGVEENKDEIDSLITKYAPEWPIDQINSVELVILRMAIWEAFIAKITPELVAINEAIDIAKVLSSDSSGSFINGVLGKMLKEIA